MVFRGRKIVRPEHLTDLDTKLWRRQQEKNSYHEYIRDTVKLWEYERKRYVLDLEPEDSPHHALPVKYMNYESLEYDRQYKRILNLHRKKRDLTANEYLSGYSTSDRVNMVDIHTLETSDIFQTDLREVFGFLKRQGNKEKLKEYVEENEIFSHLKEDAYDVLSVYSGNDEFELRKEKYRAEEGMNMCTALRELIEEGRAAGREDMNQLIRKLVADERIEDLIHSIQDSEYQTRLLAEYGIQW